MSYRLRLTVRAADDLEHLFDYLAERDLEAAERARVAIETAFGFLQTFPFACRKAAHDYPFLREMVIEFGQSGYVALFEIDDADTVTILTVRHQREDDFF